MLFFEKYGGLNFSLKCNYNTKKLEVTKSVMLFYLEMLDYVKELRQVNQDSYVKSDLIRWNNQDITIVLKANRFIERSGLKMEFITFKIF